jgi:hypothetical protein
VAHVDAGEALDELTSLSAEVEHAAVVGPSGVVAATAAADADRLARTATELLDVAALVDPDRAVDRVVVQVGAGAVFVVRDGARVAVATTGPEPAAALVVHDLRACLAAIHA